MSERIGRSRNADETLPDSGRGKVTARLIVAILAAIAVLLLAASGAYFLTRGDGDQTVSA